MVAAFQLPVGKIDCQVKKYELCQMWHFLETNKQTNKQRSKKVVPLLSDHTR